MLERLLTVKQVSETLEVHPKTIYRLANEGRLTSIKKRGLGVRFRQAEIDRWLDTGKRVQVPLDVVIPSASPVMADFDRMFLKGGKKALSKNSRRWQYRFGTIYIRQSKKGQRFCIDYRDGEGKRVREVVKHAQGREEALLILQERVASSLNNRAGKERRRSILPLEEIFPIFLEEHAKPTKKSWRDDVYRFNVIRPVLGKTKLSELTPEDILHFRQKRLASGISNHPTNRELALLKKIYSWAIGKGLVEENPVKKVKFFSEMDTARTRTLSPDEEERLLAEISSRLRPVVLTALNTGLRRSEILGLKWTDIDFREGLIRVEKPKNGKVRFIPINSTLRVELLRQKESERNLTFVFPFKSIQEGFENARRRAGCEDLTFHDLRRTFGTRMLEHGFNIVTISKLYGHSSVLVTQRYLHPQDKLSREAVESLVSPQHLAQIGHKTKKVTAKIRLSHSFSVN